jgi:hypothetical protein
MHPIHGENLSLEPPDGRKTRTERKEIHSKALDDLIKAYAGDKMKFSGESYEE